MWQLRIIVIGSLFRVRLGRLVDKMPSDTEVDNFLYTYTEQYYLPHGRVVGV